MDSALAMAPEWHTSEWFNCQAPLTLNALRGRVVLMYAFQMLCPGCVVRGIPQAQRVAEVFADSPLVVVGLHSVFEHRETRPLSEFLEEHRITFPVGVDAPGDGDDPFPKTMRAYGMRGTPTTILIDSLGRVRRQVFGAHHDLILGAELQSVLLEATLAKTSAGERDAPKRSVQRASMHDGA